MQSHESSIIKLLFSFTKMHEPYKKMKFAPISIL